jgi:hypothetical protein
VKHSIFYIHQADFSFFFFFAKENISYPSQTATNGVAASKKEVNAALEAEVLFHKTFSKTV